MPVGLPAPEVARTVAVNLTVCPLRTTLAEAARAVVVGARAVATLTCSATACELPTKLPSPL